MVGVLLLWRWTRPWVAVLAAAAAAALAASLLARLGQNFSVVYLLQEGGFYSLMAVTFGQSLLAGRGPLCTQLADKVHGPLTPQEVALHAAGYGRLGFVLRFDHRRLPSLLFILAPLRIWSLFANFCVAAA